MKIKADPTDGNNKLWDDKFDDSVIRFYERIRKNDYFYELYVLIDDAKAVIDITCHGVSVTYLDGDTIHTNLNPSQMFPKATALSWNKISKIVKILENIGIEGKRFTRSELQENFEKWKNEET